MTLFGDVISFFLAAGFVVGLLWIANWLSDLMG